MYMDKNSYHNDEKSNRAQPMNDKELLEARLFDAIEQPLSVSDSEKLKKDLAAYPALLKSYEEILVEPFFKEFKNNFIQEVSEQHQEGVIDANFEHNLKQKMDQEAFWLATISQVKGIIYKFMMPVMAASLLLFFQFSAPAVTSNIDTKLMGNEMQIIERLTGYEEFEDIQANLQSYAGIAALDAVLAELNESTNATTNTNTNKSPNR